MHNATIIFNYLNPGLNYHRYTVSSACCTMRCFLLPTTLMCVFVALHHARRLHYRQWVAATQSRTHVIIARTACSLNRLLSFVQEKCSFHWDFFLFRSLFRSRLPFFLVRSTYVCSLNMFAHAIVSLGMGYFYVSHKLFFHRLSLQVPLFSFVNGYRCIMYIWLQLTEIIFV